MEELGIGEVARRTGLATSALRYYEAQRLLPRARRRGGRRVYPASVLTRLALIELAKAAGFTLAEIRRLTRGFNRKDAPGSRWRTLAAAKREEIDRRIEDLRRMRMVLDAVAACACPTFEDCAEAMQRRRT